jgi:16S rRNA processing protein RimM
MTEDEQWVWLARVRHSQGRKGEVFADILTDFPERFAQRRALWLLSESVSNVRASAAERPATSSSCAPRAIELIAHWPHKGGMVLHFDGVNSITEAEALKGLIVAIPRAERAPLDDDAVYIGDLIGCTLLDVAGAEPVVVGEIVDVDRNVGPVALLVVNGTVEEVLVPFAKSYLRHIDMEARRVEMALPEGLTGLNAPGKNQST